MPQTICGQEGEKVVFRVLICNNYFQKKTKKNFRVFFHKNRSFYLQLILSLQSSSRSIAAEPVFDAAYRGPMRAQLKSFRKTSIIAGGSETSPLARRTGSMILHSINR